MDTLQEKQFETKRGIHYRYYVSSESTPIDTSRPVLLLLHGFPDSAELWQFVIPHLKKSNLRIVAPDLLGYGGTSKPTTPEHFNVRFMVYDIVEILDAENIHAPIIPMGHDWGSYLAQRFYLLETERCAGLITLSVAYQSPSTENFDLKAFNDLTEKNFGHPLYAYQELFNAPDGPKLLEDHLESMWYVMHGDGKEWMKQMFCVRGAMREFLSKDRKDVPLRPYARDETLKNKWIKQKQEGGMVAPCCWYRALAENHQVPTEKTLANKVKKPYLFIGCTDDAVCKTEFIYPSKEQGLLADVTIHEIESGHWCPLERPDEIGKFATEWLKAKGFSASS